MKKKEEMFVFNLSELREAGVSEASLQRFEEINRLYSQNESFVSNIQLEVNQET